MMTVMKLLETVASIRDLEEHRSIEFAVASVLK